MKYIIMTKYGEIFYVKGHNVLQAIKNAELMHYINQENIIQVQLLPEIAW
jgi:hypothetical protein